MQWAVGCHDGNSLHFSVEQKQQLEMTLLFIYVKALAKNLLFYSPECRCLLCTFSFKK